MNLFLELDAYFSQKAANEYELINLEEADIPIEVTWKAMENLVKLGFTKSVGLSNFNASQIDRIIRTGDYFPVINEVSYFWSAKFKIIAGKLRLTQNEG